MLNVIVLIVMAPSKLMTSSEEKTQKCFKTLFLFLRDKLVRFMLPNICNVCDRQNLPEWSVTWSKMLTALLTNLRLGCQSFPASNALAYLATKMVYDIRVCPDKIILI
jgi:hypothetical protein